MIRCLYKSPFSFVWTSACMFVQTPWVINRPLIYLLKCPPYICAKAPLMNTPSYVCVIAPLYDAAAEVDLVMECEWGRVKQEWWLWWACSHLLVRWQCWALTDVAVEVVSLGGQHQCKGWRTVGGVMGPAEKMMGPNEGPMPAWMVKG